MWLPDDLLRRLDEEAKRRSISRSALIASVARRELARPSPDAVAAAIARSEARFLRSGDFETSNLIREHRGRLCQRAAVSVWRDYFGASGSAASRICFASGAATVDPSPPCSTMTVTAIRG